jgi:hypothetical protein
MRSKEFRLKEQPGARQESAADGIPRRKVVQAFGSLLALARGSSLQALPPQRGDVEFRGAGNDHARDRAQAAWDALVREMALAGQPGFFAEGPGTSKYAFIWPQSQIVHAALDMAVLTSNEAPFERALQALVQYKLRGADTGYTPTPHPKPGTSLFWDDNGVVALALLQASYTMRNPGRYLAMVTELWPFLARGQDRAGGVWWREDDPQPKRGISATGSDSQVALRLHLATGAPERPSPYRAYAELNMRWLDATLRRPDGTYWNSWYTNPADNPTPPGNLCRWMFTYNQGFPLGVEVLLYRITHEAEHLERAAAIGRAALEAFPAGKLWKQPPAFNAIFFRNLLVLDRLVPDPRYLQALRSYLERVWNEGRDQQTGLFTAGGIGMYGGKPGSLDQAAVVQMFALLAWPPDRVLDLT